MGVAQQARGGELLDVAGAAPHLERVAAHLARIARGAELEHRRQHAHEGGRVLVLAGFRPVEGVRGGEA